MTINIRLRHRPIRFLATLMLASTTLLYSYGATVIYAQPSAQVTPLRRIPPQRADYPTDVVAREEFRVFKGGRTLPFIGDAAALSAWLSSPETAKRELGVSMISGLEFRPGLSARLFDSMPKPRTKTGDPTAQPVPKVMTTYSLAYRGIPLAEGSDVLSLATAGGRLLAVRERNLPQNIDGADPTVEPSTAVRVALEASAARDMPMDAHAGEPVLEIFVDRAASGHLAWKIRIASDSLTNPWARDIWVAARGKPVVLADRELIYHTHHGHVTAKAWSASPLGVIAPAGLRCRLCHPERAR